MGVGSGASRLTREVPRVSGIKANGSEAPARAQRHRTRIGMTIIACHVTYKTDPAKTADFEVYARAWISLVVRFAGTHHGYFLPHEGPNGLAFAASLFPSLAPYETYLTESATDPDCNAAYDFAVRTKCILRYDRHCLRPVLDGDISGVLDHQV
jgi:hypothetical protein